MLLIKDMLQLKLFFLIPWIYSIQSKHLRPQDKFSNVAFLLFNTIIFI